MLWEPRGGAGRDLDGLGGTLNFPLYLGWMVPDQTQVFPQGHLFPSGPGPDSVLTLSLLSGAPISSWFPDLFLQLVSPYSPVYFGDLIFWVLCWLLQPSRDWACTRSLLSTLGPSPSGVVFPSHLWHPLQELDIVMPWCQLQSAHETPRYISPSKWPQRCLIGSLKPAMVEVFTP